MQWYQKPHGERALKRIGHVYYGDIEHEESFKKHFNITGDMSGSTAKNGSLFIVNLKAPEHSAVYYCAASKAQWLLFPSPSYKNSEPTLINVYGFELEPEQAPPSQLLSIGSHYLSQPVHSGAISSSFPFPFQTSVSSGEPSVGSQSLTVTDSDLNP